jgi:hypothetical protein
MSDVIFGDQTDVADLALQRTPTGEDNADWPMAEDF